MTMMVMMMMMMMMMIVNLQSAPNISGTAMLVARNGAVSLEIGLSVAGNRGVWRQATEGFGDRQQRVW